MAKQIPEAYQKLFKAKSFAHLATIMADGTPQITPVWIDFDGQYILFNTVKGRTKDVNIRKRPHVALSIIDPENPYRYVSIRGKVVEITEEGAEEHIDHLAKRYLNQDKHPFRRPGEVREICKIEVEHIVG